MATVGATLPDTATSSWACVLPSVHNGLFIPFREPNKFFLNGVLQQRAKQSSPKQQNVIQEKSISKQFKKILRKLNLNEDFKFHSLRHSAITELIKNNVPLNIVKEIAGHKSITTTMIYSHVKSDDLRQAVNSLKY